jgi:hypothetical protein
MSFEIIKLAMVGYLFSAYILLQSLEQRMRQPRVCFRVSHFLENGLRANRQWHRDCRPMRASIKMQLTSRLLA